MNFLAHIYLSGDDDLVKIGNFMADGVRGRDHRDFPPGIEKGILLHRAIDTFTDAHPVFRQSTKRLHGNYHHYAGVVVDVIFDHFLAKNWNRYSDEALDAFVNRFYASLKTHYEFLTEKAKGMMPYMIKHNWLLSYREVEGIARILTQMDARTKNNSRMRFAMVELTEHYALFENEFAEFFEELRTFAAQKASTL